MRAGDLSLGPRGVRPLLDLAHQFAQVPLGGVRPAVPVVMPQLHFHLLHVHQFVIEEKRILRVHELRVAAPVRGDDRQFHQHRLVLRPAPAFAAARRDEAVGGLVEARQILRRDLLGENLDARPFLVAQPERRRVGADALPDGLPRIAIRLGAEIRPQVKAHVVSRGKLAQIGREEHVPALARRPLEDREKIKRGAIRERQRRVTRRIKFARVHRARHHPELRALDAAASERLDIKPAGNPDLVHAVARLHPRGREAVGLEHCAADMPLAVRQALESGGREVGNHDAVPQRREAIAGGKKRGAFGRGQPRDKFGGIEIGLMPQPERAAPGQRHEVVDGLARVAARIEHRSEPAHGRSQRRPAA